MKKREEGELGEGESRAGCWRLGRTTGYDQQSDEKDNIEHAKGTYCSESGHLRARVQGSILVEVPDTDCDSEFEFGLCKRRVPAHSRLLRSGSPQPTVRNKSF